MAKIDDVRLLESRKSARLVNSDTDFSKLADINISMTASNNNGESLPTYSLRVMTHSLNQGQNFGK